MRTKGRKIKNRRMKTMMKKTKRTKTVNSVFQKMKKILPKSRNGVERMPSCHISQREMTFNLSTSFSEGFAHQERKSES